MQTETENAMKKTTTHKHTTSTKKKRDPDQEEVDTPFSDDENPQSLQYHQKEFDFMEQNNSLEAVIKECFLIFEGTSQYNKPYKVLVVKKKYAFDPALIALFERLGVVVRTKIE